MLYLRIFILLVLVGLCLGASLEGVQSSGTGEAESSLQGEGEASLSVSGASDKTFASAVGLPKWITDPTAFMDTLLKQCHPPPYHEEERISNETNHLGKMPI
uniref:Putative secreted protein n=1 Tax=Ixodes ricinus TaxID=34613 RepID=V5GYN9_IXORI